MASTTTKFSRTLRLVIFGAVAGLSSIALIQNANASGYEKSIMWGGREAGVAGIATPYIQGSDALYFNPAGLASDRVGHTISLNVSPTFLSFKGPIDNNDDIASSSSTVVPFALTYAYTLNEKMGFGAGFYTSGGAEAKFDNVAFTGYSYAPSVKTDMQVYEFAIGGGYKVNDDLKVGLSYRVVMANAAFSLIQHQAIPNSGGLYALGNVELTGLKDTEFTGFKLGGQYKLGEQTLLGLTYRSEVNFAATGTLGGTLALPTAAGGTTSAITGSGTKVHTTFPMAVTLGAQHDISPSWRILGEYVWTQYSRIKNIAIDGTITAGGQTGPVPSVVQNWHDQHNIRLAGEYKGWQWPVRFGYIFTNQVTNSDYARPTFDSPGISSTFTLGSGQAFTLWSQALQFDGALEYTMTSGNGNSGGGQAGDMSNDLRAGKFTTDIVGVHAGLAYAF